MKVFGWICLAVLLTVALTVGGLWHKVAHQGGRIIDKTIDADNVLYTYEWFHQTYQDVLATDRKIVVVEKQLSEFRESHGDPNGWGYAASTEHDRLNGMLGGLRNYREQLRADYNARHRMVNRAIFAGRSLPETIE